MYRRENKDRKTNSRERALRNGQEDVWAVSAVITTPEVSTN